MNIEWVIPCRFVEVHDNLATIVGGGIDTFWLVTEPKVVQVMLAIKVTALHEELDRPHPMSSRVRGPGDEVLLEVTGDFAFQRHGDPEHPEFLAGIVIPSGVQFAAAQEGTYTLTHTFDESEHSLPLHVNHTPPPGIPAAED